MPEAANRPVIATAGQHHRHADRRSQLNGPDKPVLSISSHLSGAQFSRWARLPNHLNSLSTIEPLRGKRPPLSQAILSLRLLSRPLHLSHHPENQFRPTIQLLPSYYTVISAANAICKSEYINCKALLCSSDTNRRFSPSRKR